MKIFTVIFILHFYYLWVVFDIFFQPTTVIEDLNIIYQYYRKYTDENLRTSTKRLVLFVGGGLPAQHLYDYTESKIPFLRSVIEHNGTWGVSHAGVFSGCRPGHVSMIAGFYEDPIAVIRDLVAKPTFFDSVFRQSSVAFAWGSPKVVPMFSSGPGSDHIYFFRYQPEIEDISYFDRSASQSNLWVLNKFKQFVKYNVNYYKMDKESRVMFFFHLSSTDISANVHKPHSLEHQRTIKSMDMVVKELYFLVEKLFTDKQTTYLFTSDHGVTAWGSHGGGSRIETETPVIAWGAGIKKPVMSNISGDSITDNWKLAHLLKQEIKQADIAVLIAVLLGVPIPVNSVGTLPLNFLDFSNDVKLKLYLLNARQLIMVLKAKEHEVKSQLANILYYPYPDTTFRNCQEIIMSIEKAINNAEFTIAENLTKNIVLSSLAGFQYYDTYFQTFLLSCTVLSYLGMGAIIVGEIMDCNRKHSMFEPRRQLCRIKKRNLKFTYTLLFLTLLILGYVGALPSRYIIYPVTTLTLWYWAILKYTTILKDLALFHPLKINETLLYAFGTQLIVQSFYHKWFLSLILIAFCFWPGLGILPIMDSIYAVAPRKYRLFWCASCIGLSVFPILTIIGAEEKLLFKIATGIAWIIIELMILKSSTAKYFGIEFNLVSKVQILLSPLLLWNIYGISNSFENGEGLLLINQCTSYLLLVIFMGLMYYGSERLLSQFNTLSYSVGLTFLMFSTSYEAIFPLLLAANLMCWILFERMINIRYSSWPASVLNCDEIGLHNHNFRRSFFFILYLTLSFFGTGNLASVNSYDMTWVRPFLSSFSPYLIMSLTVVKIILPSILVTSAFRFVGFLTRINSKVLFMTALLMCDSMALQFLLSVKNTGSNFEIGKSVFHFLIMQLIALFLFILYRCAKYLTTLKVASSSDVNNVLRIWHNA